VRILLWCGNQQILLWFIIGKPHEYNLNGFKGETGAGLVLIGEAAAKGEGCTMNPMPVARTTASCV
jgi:hypothetical protein